MGNTSLVNWLLLFAALAVLLIVSLVGASSILSGGLAGFNFNVPGTAAAGGVNPGWYVGGLTVVGVLASLAVNVLRAQKQNEKVDFNAFVQGMLYPQTFIALCVSPVVFFGALTALDGRELGPAVYLAAFQNGFFWQRILDTKKADDGHPAGG